MNVSRPLGIVLLVLLSSAIGAQERSIQKLMEEGEVPGLSIVVIENGRIGWHRAFGVSNAETGEPLGEEAIFEAASLTKPVFAYAVLKLVDRGVLDLDTPLTRYLNEPVSDERMDERMDLITARMVLEHTTGFQNEVMPGETLKIHFTPGTRFSYSGAGFLYLQRVVEHLTGKSLPVLMRHLVFDPLNMRDTSYTWLAEYERRKVYGHNGGGGVRERRKPLQPTVATMHTTPRDYARFMMAMMKGQGLKPATARMMLSGRRAIDETCFTCLEHEPQRVSTALSWGLGWAIERPPRRTAFWHWGENNGEFQNFAMGDADGNGVVIFTNSGNGFSIIPEIVSEILPGPHPAFAWMGYEGYRSPAKLLLRDIVKRGAAALAASAVDPLSERALNAIGYSLLQRRRPHDALAVFRRIVERFPNSSNAYDSLAEAYAVIGDRENAAANYQRSLDLDPKNINAAEMLKKLRH